jgi:glycosyltransferase involved in cell wall biosynthesis
MNKTPIISVILPAYNGERYLREAVESILSQTFSDFELLIIDDGSSDRSAEIIRSYDDARIVLISNETNKGLPYSLNRGLARARGTYIARMDQDDISLPTRFEEQVRFMENHPEIGIVGAWMRSLGKPEGYVMKGFTEDEDIRANLLFNTSLAHPTIVIRAKVFQDFALLYDPLLTQGAEDYDLWVRASKVTKLASIPKILVRYRIHGNNMSSTRATGNQLIARSIRLRQLAELGLTPTEEELSLHSRITSPDENIRGFLTAQERWLEKIVAANAERHIYADASLQKVIRYRWFLLCDANAKLGVATLRYAYKSPFAFTLRDIGAVSYAKFILKTFLRR